VLLAPFRNASFLLEFAAIWLGSSRTASLSLRLQAKLFILGKIARRQSNCASGTGSSLKQQASIESNRHSKQKSSKNHGHHNYRPMATAPFRWSEGKGTKSSRFSARIESALLSMIPAHGLKDGLRDGLKDGHASEHYACKINGVHDRIIGQGSIRERRCGIHQR
jgi:hypothetical protein